MHFEVKVKISIILSCFFLLCFGNYFVHWVNFSGLRVFRGKMHAFFGSEEYFYFLFLFFRFLEIFLPSSG